MEGKIISIDLETFLEAFKICAFQKYFRRELLFRIMFHLDVEFYIPTILFLTFPINFP